MWLPWRRSVRPVACVRPSKAGGTPARRGHHSSLRALLLAATFFCLDRTPLPSAEPVSARLEISPADFYVIGDDIPLSWVFTNHSAEPFALLWEGCCRLNGRLEVTREGVALEPVPPGSSLAHQFARAERVAPRAEGPFTTLLSDWVKLRQSGRHRIQGTYAGLLPDQRPQIPRGLELWRGRTVTPPITVYALTPDDYLATTRGSRRTRDRIRLELAGTNRVPALGTATFHLTWRNPSRTPGEVVWPGGLQLWVLDRDGYRVQGGPRRIEAASEIITVPQLESVVREFALTAASFEGMPFGEYRLFVDWAGAAGVNGRVHSNPIPLSWRLGLPEVEELLRAAARGARTGARNAPLKLLRVHLADIAPELARLPRNPDPAVAALADELRLAACLRQSAPNPGPVQIVIEVPGTGAARLADPNLRDCSGREKPSRQQLADISRVRRHLGWEPSLILGPGPGVTLDRLREVAGDLANESDALSAAPRVLLSAPGGATNVVTFPSNAVPAGTVVEITTGAMALRTGTEWWPVPSLEALEARLAALENGDLPVAVTAGDELGWEQIVPVIRRVSLRQPSVEVYRGRLK